jgi:hypothetical protein
MRGFGCHAALASSIPILGPPFAAAAGAAPAAATAAAAWGEAPGVLGPPGDAAGEGVLRVVAAAGAAIAAAAGPFMEGVGEAGDGGPIAAAVCAALWLGVLFAGTWTASAESFPAHVDSIL